MGIQKTDLPAFVKSAVEKDLDLHFHVWTHDTFASMLSSVRLNIVPWSKIWTHPPGTGDIANEFYAVLTK
jgi:hypothetical protein